MARFDTRPLYMNAHDFRYLLEKLGPSLGFWRAAEIAALREQEYEAPVLDLGCGDGFLSAMVLPKIEVGLDPDQEALERAVLRQLYARRIAAPVEEAALPPASISTIFSNSALEHVARINDALSAIARALKPGGRLITTSPTEAFSKALALPLKRYADKRNRHFEHLNLWSVEEWAQRLAPVGLELETVRPYLRLPLVRLWDMLELMQMLQLGRHRVFGKVWRRLPDSVLERLAHYASTVDLSAPPSSGGRLIVARKTK
ncbi:methyltransferase family protein [Pontibacter ummariensis]|uniref:Methyltransferase domain-containing protein n=1 Tax=Pontibacter ummariensis TaxID=1610492 RepID=A0A239KI93_9BACT|nr:class I SAM-dependent methyltransferase [Pontibacter ummariensis]PRY06416.1 methyltransferase family protein [Pontibacter ummariensis]SNT16874.1 Methyltransferase domain-containing protein [Pontibacter ummariensis]